MTVKLAYAKAKGREFQKWVCEELSKILNIPWGYEDDKLIQPRIMGQSGVDVILRGRAKDLFPFDIECKATETFTTYKDIEQAKKNAFGSWWLLFHKKSRKEPIVIMDANVFFYLMAKEIGRKNDTTNSNK